MRVKAEAVATAERALMYQLGFNLVVQMPYMVLNRMSAAWQPASMPIDLKQAIFQSAWFLVNDRCGSPPGEGGGPSTSLSLEVPWIPQALSLEPREALLEHRAWEAPGLESCAEAPTVRSRGLSGGLGGSAAQKGLSEVRGSRQGHRECLGTGHVA